MKKKIDYKKLSEEYKKCIDLNVKERGELSENFDFFLYGVVEDVITLLRNEKDKKQIKKLLEIVKEVKAEVFTNWLKNYIPNNRQTLFDLVGDCLVKNKEVSKFLGFKW